MPPKLSKKQQNLLLEQQQQQQAEAETVGPSTSSKTKSLAPNAKDLPLLSDLDPKPCFTCAREITPRAKWLRNWGSITTCSDGCKAQKPSSKNTVIKVRRALSQTDFQDLQVKSRLIGNENLKLKVLHEEHQVGNGQEEGEISIELELNLERWVEDVLLRLTSGSLPIETSSISNSGADSKAGKSSVNGKTSSKSGRNDNLVSCSQVEAQLVYQLGNLFPEESINPSELSSIEADEDGDPLEQVESDAEESKSSRGVKRTELPQDSSNPSRNETSTDKSKEDRNPFMKALNSNPGLRERVRRASRRLLIFDKDSDWALSDGSRSSYSHPILRDRKISLINDGKKLHSLKDVSFAKGEIFLKLVDR